MPTPGTPLVQIWATLEATKGQILSHLPQMPPDSSGICMGVDQRNHQIAPGLSPGWFRVFTLLRKEGLLQGKVASEEERDHGEEALMFQSAHRLAFSVQPFIVSQP